MRRVSKLATASVFVMALSIGAALGASELPPEVSADSLLGADVRGDNWTVAPIVHSDGFVWIFNLHTSYGDFQVNGLSRMKDRVQELRALEVLEKMSRSKAFTGAMVRAGLAPVRFGRDLIVAPVTTVGNFASGVGKMFSTVADGARNPGQGRDPFFDSVTGITKVERDLALTLKVDPYSDFLPLRSGLEDVARVTTAGSLPVTAGIAMMSGGAGIAASSASTASQISSVVYSHTARELAEIVTKKLRGLGVGAAITKKFADNAFYSPADEYAIAEALEGLHAANSAAFIENAAAAYSFDVAKFNRTRAELLARDSARLGTLTSFVSFAGFVLNRDASGRLVAVLPFDTLSWTEAVSLSLAGLSAEIAGGHETAPPVFASVGAFSPSAQAELKTLGWDTRTLD